MGSELEVVRGILPLHIVDKTTTVTAMKSNPEAPANCNCTIQVLIYTIIIPKTFGNVTIPGC